tara:strand:+ start:14705 stop:15733 length:1029 start_codon:yes stop_codon:yes gene_type:complete
MNFIKNMNLKNKCLLVTGGTGSFGETVLKSFLNTDISEIRIFSRDEKKQYDLRQKYKNERLSFHIGDVRSLDSLNRAMSGVNYVFHAAALKQVPSCEFFPLEAIQTNTLGTENVIQSCLLNKTSKLVLLSTDKAVYPINTMGLTKALSERILTSYAKTIDASKLTLSATRYGNVMCSRGSVIPLFISQIISKQKITITDPTMTRFLMSLDEAVSLVKYAFNNASQGEIFIKKAPACTINTLAAALIDIFNAKNQIEIIGSRQGEKLYESLLSREEMSRALDHDSYYSIPLDNKELDYSKFFDEGDKRINVIEDYNSHNTNQLSINEVKEKLLMLPYVKKYLN